MPDKKNRYSNKLNFRIKKSATEYVDEPAADLPTEERKTSIELGTEPKSSLGFKLKKSATEFVDEPGTMIKQKVTKDEPGFLEEAGETVLNYLTTPLYQSDVILGEAGEEFKKAFTPTGDIEKGLSHLAGGITKTVEAPIAALLGYVNQIVEPVATAAAESEVGKAIDETRIAKEIDYFLNHPASYTMKGFSELTGLGMPEEGFLKAGDLAGQLLGFKAAEGALFKAPSVPKYGEVGITKARLKELRAEEAKPIDIPKTKPKVEVKGEAKIKETGEIPTKQGKPVVEKATRPVKEGVEKPKGADQKVKPALNEVDAKTVRNNTIAELKKGTSIEEAKLGEYGKMPTSEVMKKLKDYGALDEAKKIAERFSKGDKQEIIKGIKTEATARIMLREIERKLGKEKRAIEDHIIDTPVKNLPKGLSDKVIETAKELKNELENATITRKQGYGNQYEGIQQTKSFTINEFPDWYRRLGRDRKDILPALDKIIDGKVTETGKLIQDLKNEILNRLEGKHEEAIVEIISGKKKRIKQGDIPGDPKFQAFIKKQGKDLSLEEMAAAWDKFSEGWKKFEEQTSFKPGVDFEAGPAPKFTTAVKSAKEYRDWAADLKKKKMSNEDIISDMMDLDAVRNKQKPSYELRQLRDLGKKLGEQTGKDIIVDAKNIWVDGKRITGKQDLIDFVKPPEKPKPVEMTAEGAARKAAAEGIKEEAPKVETPKAEPAKPKNLYEALREKDTFTVKDIVEQTKESPKKVATMVQDLVANKMVDKVTTKEGKITWKPTEEFRTLLDDMIENPKVYQTDLGTLYSNPIPQVLKGLSNAQKFLDDAFKKMLGDKIYKGLGKALDKIVPEKIKEQVMTNYGLPKEYTTLRQSAKDAIERYNELAQEIGENLKYKDIENKIKFSKAEQQRLTQIIKGSIAKNPVFKERATKAINEIKQLEKLGKDLEVLPLETYNTKLPRKRINELLTKKRALEQRRQNLRNVEGAEPAIRKIESQIKDLDKKVKDSFKHGGEGYFKRVFLSKEQQTQFAKYGYYKPTRLDLTSALHRKDIPYEIRKQMGEVLEASYPVSKGIVLEGKDVSLGNFFRAIAEHPDWVSPAERPGFVKMDKTKKLGKLSDMWVEERIAADINDIIKLTSPEHLDSFLRGVNSIWKATKTIMNPSTHFRNVYSNSVMVDYSGVPHFDQFRILPDAIKAIKGEGNFAREWKASRLDKTTFQKAELQRFLDVIQESGTMADWKKLTASEKALKVYGKVTGVDTQLGVYLGKIYQMEETVFKAIKFIAEREKGKTILEARAEANKWLFDYGEIPKAVEFLRTNPLIGKPFVTWSYKAMPRIIEAAITRPIAFWKYPVIFSALAKYAISKLDITQEEWDNIKKDFGERLARGEWLLLPFRDEKGQLQMVDLTYILPYKDVYDMGLQGYSLASTGQMTGERNIFEGVMNLIDSPVTTMISEMGSNKNHYTGYEIWSAADTPGEQFAKGLDYMYKLYMPSLTPAIPIDIDGQQISQGGYSYHKLASTIAGKEDYYGRNFTFGPAFLSAFMGIKTTPVDPKKIREQKSFRLRKNLIEFSKKRSRIRKDPTMSKSTKKQKLGEIEANISKLKAEIDALGVK